MAVFPIVTGQKPDQTNCIPPHASVSTPSSQQQPPEENAHEDLIDFGQNDIAEPLATETNVQHGKASAEASSGDEILDMLMATGKPAQSGPLIDFHEDLRMNVPVIKRSDTEGTYEFHDAEE
jgi:hypothetical protein